MLLTSLIRIFLTRSLRPFEFKNTYRKFLDFEAEQELGLYVHIPFCRKICTFCPYCKTYYDKDLAAKYKLALLREIEMVGSRLKTKKEVTSLYFGGGTPALMKDSLKEIIDCLEKYFIITQGIGIELHPDDIDEPTIKSLKSAGITMVSVGVQSFNQKCLSSLGRENTGVEEKLKLVAQANFNVVDVDLIFALPKQTEELLLSDIEKAFLLGATQISTYPFIDFTFANNTYKPMPEKEKKKMLQSISDYCKRIGKERTAVWTFAQKNTGRYSSVTRDSFLGFGVSAATLLSREFKINTFSIDGYLNRIKNNLLPTSLTLDFTLRQRAVYHLFWSAYFMQIIPTRFQELIGRPLSKMYGLEIWLAENLGFITKQNDTYCLTDRGAYYYHYLEQAYTTAYIDKMWNISRITPFPEKIVLK